MSRSSRQIGQPAQLLRQQSALSTYGHRRTGSIQNKNFLQLLQLGKKYYQSNQLGQAVEIMNRGLYYDPFNLETNYLLGVSQLALGHYAEAAKHLAHVARQQPTFTPQLLLLLAIAHRKLGAPETALEWVSRLLASSPSPEALFLRASLFRQLGKEDQAAEDLATLLGSNPRHASALLLRAECLVKLGRTDSALSAIAEARTAILEVDHLQQLGVLESEVLGAEGRWEEAVGVFGRMQEQFGSLRAETFLAKAKICQKAGRSQEALMLYNQILGRNCSPRVFSTAMAEAAISCMRERDFYEAFSYLRRSQFMGVRCRATDQLLRLAEGVTFLMKKKFAEAMALMGSCQLQFKHQLKDHLVFLSNLWRNALAFGHFSLGSHEKALEFYQQIAPERSTDGTAASYNICICEGVLEHVRGRKEHSLSLFQKAAEFILRPQPFFYMAVSLNEDFLQQPVNTDGFVRVLQLIEKGLRAGENAHMYYYRAVLYLYLGMNNQALEDIDRAIEKSEDNVAKYFHARGVIFFLDKNYEQAIMEFGTALSIDEHDQLSILERAKCELLHGEQELAFRALHELEEGQEWVVLFLLQEKQYSRVLESEPTESVRQICSFMLGKFEEAGPSGKLVLAILYENYSEVVSLIEEAVGLGVAIGCLQINDLLMLKGLCEYRLGNYEEALLSLARVETALRESSARSETYSEEDERKLLLCRVDIILLHFRRGHQLEAVALAEELASEVCEGPIYDEVSRLKDFLTRGGEHEVELGFNTLMLSDFLAAEQFGGLTFRFLLPMPQYRVAEVELPQYEQLLLNFGLADIENRPEAPWIRRGQFGLIFTNEVREFADLNLKTEENEGLRSRMLTHEQSKALSRKRSQLMEELRLSTSVLDKLERLANRRKQE